MGKVTKMLVLGVRIFDLGLYRYFWIVVGIYVILLTYIIVSSTISLYFCVLMHVNSVGILDLGRLIICFRIRIMF